MTEVLEVPRESIQLDTEMDRRVGAFRRRRVWAEVAAKTGLELPGLELPNWVALFLLASMLTPLLAIGVWNFWAALPVFLATPFLGAGLFWLGRPFA